MPLARPALLSGLADILRIERGANQGNSVAQYNLGGLYYADSQVPKNYRLAYKWLSLSAAQGDKDSLHMLSELKLFLPPGELADGQRLVRDFVPHPEKVATGDELLSL